MHHRYLSDPDDLDRLSTAELWRRVRPLVTRGRFPTSPEQRARMRLNAPFVLAELREQWRQAADGGEFGEFVKLRFLNRLRGLDKIDKPEAYDAHGHYLGEETVDVFEDEFPVAEPERDDTPPPAAREATLQEALCRRGIAAATTAAIASALAGIASGEITSPYSFARICGLSRAEARVQPATAIFEAYRKYAQAALGATYLL